MNNPTPGHELMRVVSWTLALLLLLCGANVDLVGAGKNFQSGRMNGALYAGGMDYSHNFLYVTGISYATNGNDHTKEAMCFVSKFKTHKMNSNLETISRTIGNGENMFSCHTIGLMHDPKFPSLRMGREKIFVAGTDGSSRGFLKEVDPSMHVNHSPKFRIHKGAGDTQKVSYPIQVLYAGNNDSPGDGEIYVVSLTSSDPTVNPSNDELLKKSNNQPNWLKYYKAGDFFQMRLQKFKSSSIASNTTVEEVWRRDYFTEKDSAGNSPDVYVGGMILSEDYLIVAGSTSGVGRAYGYNNADSGDEDGFITLVKADKGFMGESNVGTRVGTAKTDLILGICDDPNDSDSFYIVGATGDPNGMGNQVRKHHMVLSAPEGSIHGFIQKRSKSSLDKVWGVTWGAKQYENAKNNDSPDKTIITSGIDCKVLSDGTVYVAGVVENNGHVLRDPENEVYGDNIVAMSLQSSTGEVNWIKQIGSSDGNENLARSGSIVVEPLTNNMILFGDTTGSMFRHREDESDNASGIFLVNLSKEDGSYAKKIPEKNVDSSQSDVVEETQGMLSGGDWKDDEVYGKSDWVWKDGMGIQSGPSVGSVFAGGMVYDPDEEAAYVTGIAYEQDLNPKFSSCMVTKIPLNPSRFYGWASATGKLIGQNDALEVCSSIALHGYGEVVNIGYTDMNSTLLAGKIPENAMGGFAMALDRYGLEEVDVTPLLSGQPQSRFQYPVDVLSDGNDLYILSLTSTDRQVTTEFSQLMNSGGANRFAPNWINMHEYGSSFYMTVSKITLAEDFVDGVSLGSISFTVRWVKEFPINSEGFDANTIPRVFLGGAIIKNSKGYLAVSGSTRGLGEGYGAAHGEDEDGFITLLDMNTGELSTTAQMNNIRKGTEKDDFILGICHDPNDDASFYVVGGTEGVIGVSLSGTEIAEGSTQAFLMKINADSLATIWSVSLGAIHKTFTSVPATVKAFDCAVQGDTIYLAGIVDDNAVIVHDNGKFTNSRGGDDIWLGSFATETGNMNWLRQMGSKGNDHLATRGAIVINKNGNVVLFGDTSGEFYREHTVERNINELFLLEVSSSGEHKPHVKHHKNNAFPGPNPNALEPAPTPVTPSIPVSPPKTTAPPFLINPTKELSKKKGLSTGARVSLILIGVIVCICLVVFVVFFRKRSGRQSGAETSKIQVKDGIITIDKGENFARAPPSSSFQHAEEPEGYSDNLRIEDKDII